MNELCHRLGISIPIIQAPMGSVAGPELCRAVSQTGALGSMGLTWTTTEEALLKVEKMDGLPFMANYVLHFEPKTLPAVVEAGAPVVAFSWGDPSPHLKRLRKHGVVIGIQAGSVAGIRRFAALEPDFLILQGYEAGGHVQSHTPLLAMIDEAVDAAGSIPLAVAGGLTTGTDVASVLRRGAHAAVLGTRFIATDEADAHAAYKSAIVNAQDGQTVMTVCFEGGWPDALHRVLRNSTFDTWEAAGCPLAGNRPGEGETIALSGSGESILRYEDAAPRRATSGRIEEMCLYAGAKVGDVQDCPPASDLVHRIWSEASSLL